MILDASCLVAILGNEPEREEFLAVSLRTTCRMSVATWLESCLVLDNRSQGEAARLDNLVIWLNVELVPVSVEHASIARAAHQRFGRGSGSPAKLNFGDCFAYALAIETGEPLLFKGGDFRHTDVTAAL